ncbi:MAG: response regulator [Planctomycetales bacterium]|nr:response regulator [Planctomycetales bacterium]
MTASATILIIDDSATIRRLAERCLGNAGYNVISGPTAEEGLSLAQQHQPRLILLDHQLPGTTGRDVCQKLLDDPVLRSIPVVASSTLRKQAYVEYADCPNVIDMLPKPYTEELLLSTVSHALETGAMVVDSQEHGQAVPEVINAVGEAELSGKLNLLTAREVVDFLNNGHKSGAIEFTAKSWRMRIFINNGRIQAVTANSVPTEFVTGPLPDSLQTLAPVLNLTLSSQNSSELGGLVQLLNNRLVDSRLLKKLLRYQAAMLVYWCFTRTATEFQFEANAVPPKLYQDLPLDISLVALLVEACLVQKGSLQPIAGAQYVKRAIRGQNLDRAGLSAAHQKLFSALSQPQTLDQIASANSLAEDEAAAALHGFELADLVEVKEPSDRRMVVMFEPDAALSQRLRAAFQETKRYHFRVVRDRLSLLLSLKRESPFAVVGALDAEDAGQVLTEAHAAVADSSIRWIGVTEEGNTAAELPFLHQTIVRPFEQQGLIAVLEDQAVQV